MNKFSRNFVLLISSSVCLMTSNISHASKKIDHSIPIAENQSIEIRIKIADEIIIRTHSGDTLEIHGEASVNNGMNDEAYFLKVESSGASVRVESGLTEKSSNYRLIRSMDKDGNVVSSNRSIDIYAKFEVSIPRGRPVLIETINGNLNMRFMDLGKSLKVKTINGEIDLILSKNANIDLSLETIHGECYADSSYVSEFNGFRKLGGRKMKLQLNRGGIDVNLKTINGNMFLRSE